MPVADGVPIVGPGDPQLTGRHDFESGAVPMGYVPAR